MENTPEKEKEKEKEIVNRFSNFGSKMGTSIPIDPNALIEGKFDNSRFLKKTHFSLGFTLFIFNFCLISSTFSFNLCFCKYILSF